MGYRAYIPNVKAIGRYFEMEGFEGGAWGEFRKTDRTRPLVMCQRTYIPRFKTIGLDFEILGGKSPPLAWMGGKSPLGGEWGGSPPLGDEWAGISENWKWYSLSNGVQSIHTEFQCNRTIFRDGGIWGKGGGEFRKTNKTRPLVICQRTYVPSFKTIWLNFETFKFGGGGSPPWGGEWGANSENWKEHSLSNVVQSIHTKFRGKRTIFRDRGFWGGFPPRGERGGISTNGLRYNYLPPKQTCIQNFMRIHP